MELERSYYCHLARGRMSSLQAEGDHDVAVTPMALEAPLEESSSETMRTLEQDEHFRKSGELMLLGFEGEAMEELVHLSTRYGQDLFSTLRINEEFMRIGNYHRSLMNLRQNFSSILERGQPAVSKRFWQQAYPLGFFESIETEAQRNGIDPFFVAAVIREESAFNPQAISRTGALGLMQVMPYTGEWIASKINQDGYESEHLFHSEMNIRFGTWYLAHLAQKFGGNLYQTAAAYNAGPEAVSKWLQQGSSQQDDEFVESIPFRETRFFVKRVLRSYREYHHVHDQTLGTPPVSSGSNPSLHSYSSSNR
jgi:soluble lytic murein transglycosylase